MRLRGSSTLDPAKDTGSALLQNFSKTLLTLHFTLEPGSRLKVAFPTERFPTLVKNGNDHNLVITFDGIDQSVRKPPEVAVPEIVRNPSPRFWMTKNPANCSVQFVDKVCPQTR